jgi:outer membrane protein OmpA-like peptidoglycan-associated protein
MRINFPLDEYQNPYKYTLDSLGTETNRTWEEELHLLTTNILKSKAKIKKIILVGHTDDIASEEYNIQLGRRRVQFVISELIKLGVPQELLEGRSAGKNEPLTRLDNEDISIYRKRLRRVTLEKILKE